MGHRQRRGNTPWHHCLFILNLGGITQETMHGNWTHCVHLTLHFQVGIVLESVAYSRVVTGSGGHNSNEYHIGPQTSGLTIHLLPLYLRPMHQQHQPWLTSQTAEWKDPPVNTINEDPPVQKRKRNQQRNNQTTRHWNLPDWRSQKNTWIYRTTRYL